MRRNPLSMKNILILRKKLVPDLNLCLSGSRFIEYSTVHSKNLNLKIKEMYLKECYEKYLQTCEVCGIYHLTVKEYALFTI